MKEGREGRRKGRRGGWIDVRYTYVINNEIIFIALQNVDPDFNIRMRE